MAIVLALPNLFDNVVARFAADATDATNYFGWREVEKHKIVDRRIVWVPGDPSGSLGDIVGPRNPGQNPRPLLNLEELFTCYIGAFDGTSAENERAQYIATRLLFDAWLRAVYKEAHGTFTILSSSWNTSKNDRRHGAELVIIATVQAVIPDEVFDIAPADTGAILDTYLDEAFAEQVEIEAVAFPTLHFNIGKLGAPSVAASPGVPDVNAMSEFGQLNINISRIISVCHLHGIEDKGAGSMTVDVFRRRSAVVTYLGSMTINGGSGDYATGAMTPSETNLQAGDYLFCQLSAYSGGGGYDGITVDIHFA